MWSVFLHGVAEMIICVWSGSSGVATLSLWPLSRLSSQTSGPTHQLSSTLHTRADSQTESFFLKVCVHLLKHASSLPHTGPLWNPLYVCLQAAASGRSAAMTSWPGILNPYPALVYPQQWKRMPPPNDPQTRKTLFFVGSSNYRCVQVTPGEYLA